MSLECPPPPGGKGPKTPRPRRARKEACSEPHHKPCRFHRGNVASAGHHQPVSGQDETEHHFYREQGAAIQVGLLKTAQRPLVGLPKTIVDGPDNEPPESEFSGIKDRRQRVRCRLSLPRHEVN